jgi:hypothetical protein
MESTLRKEVQEFVRACNDLAGSAHDNNGMLTNEECDIVVASIQALQKFLSPQASDDKTVDTDFRVLDYCD